MRSIKDRDLRALADIEKAFLAAPATAAKAAVLALNDAARRGRTLGSKAIREQVALKADYVNQQLTVSKLAKESSLEARISANPRPVLLTRYGAQIRTEPTRSERARLKGDPSRGIAAGRKAVGTKGVKVKRGGTSHVLRNTFWVRLRGTNRWEPAERTGPGRSDYRVLHSTSVDQAWRSVRADVEPQVMERAASEFTRQFLRLS